MTSLEYFRLQVNLTPLLHKTEKILPEITLRRSLQDWEVDDLIKLLATLEGTKLNVQAAEKFNCGDANDGKYTVQSGYKWLKARNEVTSICQTVSRRLLNLGAVGKLTTLSNQFGKWYVLGFFGVYRMKETVDSWKINCQLNVTFFI